MDTVQDMENMPMEKREAYKKHYYAGWAPYCLMCNYGDRMHQKTYGWQCPKCKNMIGHHLRRLAESPLNTPGYHVPGMYPIENRAL